MPDAPGAAGTTSTDAAAAASTDAAAGTSTPSPADIAARAAAAAAAQPDADAKAAADAAAAAVAADDKGGSPWDDPAKAKAEIDRLRRENGDERILAKKNAADEARKELLATLTQALDPDAAKAGEQLTLEQATEKLTATSGSLVAVEREKGVVAEAWKQNLDPAKSDLLQFKLERNADYKNLDPADAQFSAKLAAVISQEVTKDPTLKLSGAAFASGVEQHGGSGGATTITKAEFKAMSYAERLNLATTNRAEYDRLNAER